jgi:hypothetical protein
LSRDSVLFNLFEVRSIQYTGAIVAVSMVPGMLVSVPLRMVVSRAGVASGLQQPWTQSGHSPQAVMQVCAASISSGVFGRGLPQHALLQSYIFLDALLYFLHGSFMFMSS